MHLQPWGHCRNPSSRGLWWYTAMSNLSNPMHGFQSEHVQVLQLLTLVPAMKAVSRPGRILSPPVSQGCLDAREPVAGEGNQRQKYSEAGRLSSLMKRQDTYGIFSPHKTIPITCPEMTTTQTSQAFSSIYGLPANQEQEGLLSKHKPHSPSMGNFTLL